MTRVSICRLARCRAFALLVSLGGLMVPLTAHGQVVFNEIQEEAGIHPYFMAIGPHGGVAAADFNGDNFIDFFVPNGEGYPDQLYLNLGDGTFEEIAAAVGLDHMQNSRTAVWFDYDGDHDLDLVIGGDCRIDPVQTFECDDPENLWLYEQLHEGVFENVTVAAGLHVTWGGTSNWHRSGISVGDINNDGYLDLLVVAWDHKPYLFLNNTDGTFTDITVSAGIPQTVKKYQQSIMHDFDRDGLQDIYLAIDAAAANALYINQGNETFINQASAAGVANQDTDMGVALGDYDNDGRIDFFITMITPPGLEQFFHNRLYHNITQAQGPLQYVDVSQALDVDDCDWGWGVTFIDCDNDGWQDIAATNGKNWPGYIMDESKFWLNPGEAGGPFLDVSASVQFDDTYIGTGLVAVDFDRDGDLDLVQTTSEEGPLRFLRNDQLPAASKNNYLVVQPRMEGANHLAIGATVTVKAGGRTTARAILVGTSQDSQEPAEAHFGLGDVTNADEVRVQWPDGNETVLTNVPANQVLVVNDVPNVPTGACCLPNGECTVLSETACSGEWDGDYQGDNEPCDVLPCPSPCPADLDGSAVIGFGDLLLLLNAWGPCIDCVEDLDGNGAVGFADLLVVLDSWGPCE